VIRRCDEGSNCRGITIMKPSITRIDAIDWLMEGDPAIRWQTMRDILGAPKAQWQREQNRIAGEGWGGQLMGVRDPGGTWGGGIYVPKWTSTTYTLLLLRDMGLPRDNPAGSVGARLLLDRGLGLMSSRDFASHLTKLDLCITGMWLGLAVHFGLDDERIEAMARQLLDAQMNDGGWNCAGLRRQVHHSSLHTTINVLDGLADYAKYRKGNVADAVNGGMCRGREFLLAHRLFRSDKTGEVIRETFTKFSFPPRWHWDVLRGLDHFRRMNAPDTRLQDAIDLLLSKRCDDGRWRLENHHRGKEFFRLEAPGQPSRWNTLRALRVLRWWNTKHRLAGT
jgi:hypothetical protein